MNIFSKFFCTLKFLRRDVLSWHYFTIKPKYMLNHCELRNVLICHSRAGGNPESASNTLDLRLRGDDRKDHFLIHNHSPSLASLPVINLPASGKLSPRIFLVWKNMKVTTMERVHAGRALKPGMSSMKKAPTV